MAKQKVSFLQALGLSKVRSGDFYNDQPTAPHSLAAGTADRIPEVTSQPQFAYGPNNAQYRGNSVEGVGLLTNDYDQKRENFQPIVPSVFSDTEDGPPPTYRVQQIDFSQLAVDLPVPIQGNCVFFIASTNLTDTLQLKFDDANADRIPMVPGVAINGFPFTRLWLSWSVVAPATTGFLLIVKGPKSLRLT